MLGPGKMIPMLNVRDIFKSIEFYQDALGFKLVSPMEEMIHFKWGIISSGEAEFMLSESDELPKPQPGIDPLNNASWPVNFYFYPTDIIMLYQHLTKLDLAPTPLKPTDYGMQEFSVQDPDGHLLSFGAEV